LRQRGGGGREEKTSQESRKTGIQEKNRQRRFEEKKPEVGPADAEMREGEKRRRGEEKQRKK
jgi:hypothetical protein